MNNLGRQILFWRKPGAEVSRFANVLPRIRTIREERDWQPLSSASAAEQRRERVRSARRRISYRPISYERGLVWRLPLRRTWWLWLTAAGVVFGVAALIFVVALTDWGTRSSNKGFRYQLPATPAFLTESLALAKASESLIRASGNSLLWRPEECPNPSKAPDGTQDRYLFRYDRANSNVGLITFSTAEPTNGTRVVYVQLTDQTVYCTVSEPK